MNETNLHNFVVIFPLFVVDTVDQKKKNVKKKGFNNGFIVLHSATLKTHQHDDNGIGFKSREEMNY